MTPCGTGSQAHNMAHGEVTDSSGWAGPQEGRKEEAEQSWAQPLQDLSCASEWFGQLQLGCRNNGVYCSVGQKLFSDPLTLLTPGFSSSD